MKLGFFDSGLGGRLIMEAVRKQMPQYDYAFYGDTAHVPYGERSEENIFQLTKTGVEYLMEKEDCVIVILACNTASAETLRRLQDEWLPTIYPERRILGVIIPTVEAVLESACRRVLLLATSRTVSSGKYHLELGKRNEQLCKIEAISMPTLVPHIEAGNVALALADVLTLLTQRREQGVMYDGIILGCTHYSLLAKMLRSALGEDVSVFAQTEIIPPKLAAYLVAHKEISNHLTMTGATRIHTTGTAEMMQGS